MMLIKINSYLRQKLELPYHTTIFINVGNQSALKPPANARIVAQNAPKIGLAVAVQSSNAKGKVVPLAEKKDHTNGFVPNVAQ